MIRLTVSSLPLKDVISDLADALQTNFSQHCGIYILNIPPAFGTGIVAASDFENGLGLIQYDCTFDQDVVIDYSVDKVHPVKFLYCMEGDMNHKFGDESIWHEIPKFKNAIVASSAHHGHSVRFKAGKRLLYNSLELDRRAFQAKIACDPVSISSIWRNMLNDVTALKTFYHDGYYSLQLATIFEEWTKFDENDFLKKLYLEGIAYKILVLQIDQFQDDIKSDGKKTVLRKSEVYQLSKAVKLIESQLEDLPTIQEIAAEVGLNANKLQQGFKDLFGNTINGFVRQKRMETARTLLLNTDYTLQNITGMIGFQSQSYFSKIFREFYGILPSEFRKTQ